MKLFYVERPDSWDYDEYSDFVICTESEETARNTHPSQNFQNWKDEPHGTWIRLSEINTLKVIYLGEADKDLKEGIICSSFHAG